MTQLSSNTTYFFKHLFPILWFGIVVAVSAVMVASGVLAKAPAVILSPVFLAVLGFVLMKTLLWDLMDAVIDQGDSLMVRNNGDEEIIPLSNIMNVSMTTLVNPPRVTLRLVEPCRFGQQVVFTPVVGIRLNPFARLPAIDDLMMRVDQARAKRGG